MMRRIAVFVTVFLFALVFVAQAQDHFPVTFIAGHPYSARCTVTVTRQLVDGTSARGVHESIEWRDALGRTRNEQIEHSTSGGEQRIITVDDPITLRHLAWTVGPRIEKVFVTRIGGPVYMLNYVPDPDSTPAQRGNPNATDQHLGTAIINGLEATGVRTVIVIPAGTEGNEHEIQRVYESWRSTALGVDVRASYADPRTGVIDLERTEISRSNPDASLFEPPPGF